MASDPARTYYVAECDDVAVGLSFGPRGDGQPHPLTVTLPCVLEEDCPAGGQHELRQVDQAEYEAVMREDDSDG